MDAEGLLDRQEAQVVRRDPLEIPEGLEHAAAARVLVDGRLPSLWQAGRCPNGKYIEPDFWEYYFGVWATHYYQERSGDQSIARCNDQNSKYGVAENEWFTAGTLVTDVPEMKYYKNDQLVLHRKTSSPCDEANSSGVKTAAFITELKNGDYPILVGSKNGEMITIDYVRVWLAP